MDAKPLTELEQLVMLSVARLGEDAYAARVRRDLVTETGRRIVAATVHVTLVRLEERGFVRSAMSTPEAVAGGRSTRCFSLTPEGRAALRESRRVMEAMWSRVGDEI